MMYESFSKIIYSQIIDIETTLFVEFKINPFDLLRNMSILDFQSFMTQISKKFEKQAESRKNSTSNNKFAKALLQIRDILNFATGLY